MFLKTHLFAHLYRQCFENGNYGLSFFCETLLLKYFQTSRAIQKDICYMPIPTTRQLQDVLRGHHADLIIIKLHPFICSKRVKYQYQLEHQSAVEQGYPILKKKHLNKLIKVLRNIRNCLAATCSSMQDIFPPKAGVDNPYSTEMTSEAINLVKKKKKIA